MISLKKLLGLDSKLGEEISKELELEEKRKLLERVDYLYAKYKGLVEQADSLVKAKQLVKDLAIVLEIVNSGEDDGLRVQQQEEQEEAESASGNTEEVNESSDDLTGAGTEAKSHDTGVMIFKDVNGRNRWLGIVSNNYTDRHAEIISQEGHLDFVSSVKSGEYPYPELWFHHDSDLVIGQADYVNFDEQSGMLIASGTFHEKWEEIGDNLPKSGEMWGMSHGMPNSEIIKDKDNPQIYKRYRSKEFSLLRLNKAANPLTAFS